jgi:L-threonylcarbamoyladenylate synthase
MNTVIMKANDDAVTEAVRLLKAGEVVAIPTETVYGLAACALEPSAVEKIFAAKGRPRDNPLIVHVSGLEMARTLGLIIPPLAEKLAERFWAGALTIVLRRIADVIPPVISCGLDTVAVRVPAHPTALAIIKACGFPLAAPSANISGSPSPTEAAHVYADLNGKIPLIIDGGSCSCGVESTVVMLENERIRILRPGAVTAEMLSEYGEVMIDDGGSPRSPGTRYRHYSPRAEVIAVDGGVAGLGEFVIAEPEAKTLYAKLREFDELGADRIYIKLPEPEGIGLALYNRIVRAAEFNVINLNRKNISITGLTGMSGAGKSLAAGIFGEHGYRVVDCDAVARSTIANAKCAEAIKQEFPELYDEHGVFDRKKAAHVVFSDSEKLTRYEAIVYPYIVFDVAKLINQHAGAGSKRILLDAPTLYQSGADGLCGVTVAVIADKATCVRRITARDAISEADAFLRLNSQPDAAFYRNTADYCIENDGDEDSFRESVLSIIDEIGDIK